MRKSTNLLTFPWVWCNLCLSLFNISKGVLYQVIVNITPTFKIPLSSVLLRPLPLAKSSTGRNSLRGTKRLVNFPARILLKGDSQWWLSLSKQPRSMAGGPHSILAHHTFLALVPFCKARLLVLLWVPSPGPLWPCPPPAPPLLFFDNGWALGPRLWLALGSTPGSVIILTAGLCMMMNRGCWMQQLKADGAKCCIKKSSNCCLFFL